MKHLLGLIGMAITMSIASQSAVAFDGKTYSPPNVVPPFLIMNSLGLEVALFDAFGMESNFQKMLFLSMCISEILEAIRSSSKE